MIIQKLESKLYGEYAISEYLPKSKVRIKFLKTGYGYVCYKSQALSGQVKDLYHRSVCGVGYIGGKEFSWSSHTKIYDVWNNMLKRCYTLDAKTKRTCYEGCTVTPEWHNFPNFASWYIANMLSEDTTIDKDLLVPGNKIYSASTCCLVPNQLNCAIRDGGRNSGVSLNPECINSYRAQVSTGVDSLKYLGSYKTQEEAFEVYKQHKIAWIKELAEKFREVITDRVYEALLKHQPRN